ncbi:flagellar biosynthesis regulator FlaF [Sedimentitalea todarodis]|uniref:Flagellar biosynthesis regulator FlaF n=1 Tax=Sedimentitalea todarodis TaxID=1631240 RepID=A0ABU3VA93_9RHOB|nr:flagellar biosynthesis regulator FlaF [Sedimentitalea todarodis]MDU9003087.1 flagellar biosynthesis regulator FlaF [Sedimentitalea todarodis]
MNALSQAHRAYSAASAPTRTTRGTEYEAIARITTRIRSADAEGAGGFAALAEALSDNRKLWTIFAIDVADKANPLPADLRARILYLAEFTNHHTSKVLARQATIEPLLEINTAILRGLRGGTQ